MTAKKTDWNKVRLPDVERELCARSFVDFVKSAWHVLEPGRTYHHNWHIDAICDHLQACTRRDLQRLVINIPPRCMKSLIVSVCWPVWSWIADPGTRWLTASYAQQLSTRDALKSRRLMQSQWFQERWGDKFQLTSDQNVKSYYVNDHMGQRIATAVDAMATGEGGDFQVVDDPHNVQEGESEAKRESTVLWLSETMSSRFNDFERDVQVIVQQRVHERDCSGYVLQQGGYTHLCLPMRFERMRLFQLGAESQPNPDYVPPTPLGFEDPREEEGELLWESRFTEATVEKLEHALGGADSYAAAGQLQQRPAPRAGGMIQREMIRVIDPSEVPRLRTLVRSYDFAGTDPEKNKDYFNPDWTAGGLYGVDNDPDPNFYIMDMQRFRANPGQRDERVVQQAHVDGVGVSILVEQEPGQSGKSQILHLRQLLSGYSVNPPRVDPMPASTGANPKPKMPGVPTGSKVQRAEPFATAVARGKVFMVRGPWNMDCLNEFGTFPMSAKKDQTDATSQAFNHLMGRPLGVAELMSQSEYYTQGV